MSAKRASGFDRVEVLLICALVGAVAWSSGRYSVPESLPNIGFIHPEDRDLATHLKRTYGPAHSSAGPEEWIVRDVFRDKRNGVFVDVGAWKAELGSNTFYLERELGWRGIAVDASPEYAAEWRQKRPHSRFVVAFADALDGEPRTLYVTDSLTSVSSTVADFVKLWGKPSRTIEGTSATLDTLLSRSGFDHVDFVSMDIELSEPAALKGFSIRRYKPQLVCIEAHPPVRQQILDYFAHSGYVQLGKYMAVDATNFYFVPLANTVPAD
jgi:FkbM family methyltransferase